MYQFEEDYHVVFRMELHFSSFHVIQIQSRLKLYKQNLSKAKIELSNSHLFAKGLDICSLLNSTQYTQ